MTWKRRATEKNWNYLGYIASNLRSVLVPLQSKATIHLTPRDHDYLIQAKKFFESAIAGCSSYSQPELLMSVKDRNVPPAASALRIAVEVYTQVHATPPANLQDFADTLRHYNDILDQIGETEFVPEGKEALVTNLNRFLEGISQKAIAERYRVATQ